MIQTYATQTQPWHRQLDSEVFKIKNDQLVLDAEKMLELCRELTKQTRIAGAFFRLRPEDDWMLLLNVRGKIDIK